MRYLARFAASLVLSIDLSFAFTNSQSVITAIILDGTLQSQTSPRTIGCVHSQMKCFARPATFRRKRTVTSAKSAGDEPPSQMIPTTTPKVLSLTMIVIPLAGLIFPNLLQLVRSLPPNSTEQFAAVTVLFVYNRVYLYVMAATIVGLAASRGSNDAPQLGRRITDLTEELLYRPTLPTNLDNPSPTLGAAAEPSNEKPLLIRSLADSGIEKSLDQVSTETQALLLPLLVSFFLALSIFLLPFWSGAPTVVTDTGEVGSTVRELLTKLFPAISQGWNVGLLALFTRAEVRRLGFELKWIPESAVFEWVAAVTITGLACLTQVWQAQNFVNMALAILVARAIQLDSFVAVVAALTLLTVYDATSVFLIPAAGASEILVRSSGGLASSTMDLAAESTAAGSAMGSIAIQKLTSGTFAPGLLTTKIGNGLGGALGLGDAVFPSMMATFAKRFDDAQDTSNDKRVSLFPVTMAGYLLGCLACEFTPLISTSGLPALLFIIPLMLGSLILASAISGQLKELVSYDPKNHSR
jgi:Signal peptide peptidase